MKFGNSKENTKVTPVKLSLTPEGNVQVLYHQSINNDV